MNPAKSPDSPSPVIQCPSGGAQAVRENRHLAVAECFERSRSRGHRHTPDSESPATLGHPWALDLGNPVSFLAECR